MTSVQSRLLNALGLLALSFVLLSAFYDQFEGGDIPCPLCILQRAGFAGAMVGLALNVRFGPKPSHYAVTILSALAGSLISVRQILLHVVPGTGSYGSDLLGLHFYTWALIVSFLIVAGSAVMLMSDRQFEPEPGGVVGRTAVRGLALVALVVSLVMVFGNGVSTVVECEGGLCPDNPTGYMMLGTQPPAP